MKHMLTVKRLKAKDKTLPHKQACCGIIIFFLRQGANIMKKLFKIYTQRMASQLMSDGFVIQKVMPDERHVGYNIFLFNDSEQLKIRVKELQEEFKNDKTKKAI